MKRLIAVVGLVSVVCVAVSPSQAVPPDQIDSYRVLPAYSTFTQSGGFAGVNNLYEVEGEYDFRQEWSGGTPDEPLDLSVRFTDTDLRAPLGDLLPAFIDVDETLNLGSLRGELLPQPFAFTPYEVYRFEGIINDGAPASPLESSTIELFAVTLGPWMYLRGETTPRPWMADFFEYEIRTLARTGDWGEFPDWNDDGLIDAADYTVLRDLVESPALEPLVGWDRLFQELNTAYGEGVPSLDAFDAAIETALSQQTATAVPEPSMVVLLALAVTPALGSRRSGCRL